MDPNALGTGDLDVKSVIGKGILPVGLAFKPARPWILFTQGRLLLPLPAQPDDSLSRLRLQSLTSLAAYITTVVYIASSGE
jgi:hypothetical protein